MKLLATAVLSAPLCLNLMVVEAFIPLGRRHGTTPPSLKQVLHPPPLGVGTIFRRSTTSQHYSTATTEQTSTFHNASQNHTNSGPRLDDYDEHSITSAVDAASDDYDAIVPHQVPQQQQKGNNKLGEYLGLGTWITALSSFLLVNNFVGPWPAQFLTHTPVAFFGLTHAVAGMLFGGGVILTTLIEWLVTSSKNPTVLNFWFGKVPGLDAFVVLPALTASIVSGVGLSVDHYGSLGQAPFHVVAAISTLLAFAGWWAVTDITTQEAAAEAIEEWTTQQQQHNNRGSSSDAVNDEVPRIVELRKISNVVSCMFVAAIYSIMVLKPGM